MIRYGLHRLRADLVRAMHARGSGEAARRAKRGRQLSRLAPSVTCGDLRVSRFARWTTEKRETARGLWSPKNCIETP